MRMLVIAIATLVVAGCCHCEQPDIIPSCIRTKIDSLSALHISDPAYKIERIEKGNVIYYSIPPECCDGFGVVMDANCQPVCLTGGFNGQGDGKCPDFTDAKVTTIWQDPRGGL